MLGDGGQPVDDVLKYIDRGGSDRQVADDRLEGKAIMLWCGSSAPMGHRVTHAGQHIKLDSFALQECPHMYFVGGQPRFDPAVMEGSDRQ